MIRVLEGQNKKINRINKTKAPLAGVEVKNHNLLALQLHLLGALQFYIYYYFHPRVNPVVSETPALEIS